MDFRGLVWKRVWKITFFSLKSGQDSENEAARPHQEFPEVPPPPPGVSTFICFNTLSNSTERTDATKKKKEKEKWDNQT